MRKIILTTGLFLFAMLFVAGAYAYEVNEKVLKSFNEIFPTAEHVKWEEHTNYYTVSFVHSGIEQDPKNLQNKRPL